ncbi:hypothetical protein BX070DRAFT_220182 [Coemansia spiralis]|nr:hypothetical protein BX070DRAFT_220182 [Coemansia spiralis]
MHKVFAFIVFWVDKVLVVAMNAISFICLFVKFWFAKHTRATIFYSAWIIKPLFFSSECCFSTRVLKRYDLH